MRKTHSHKYLKYVFQQILQWVWLLRRFASPTNGHAWSDPSEADAAMFCPGAPRGARLSPKNTPNAKRICIGSRWICVGSGCGPHALRNVLFFAFEHGEVQLEFDGQQAHQYHDDTAHDA